jgi:hypothetical protein
MENKNVYEAIQVAYRKGLRDGNSIRDITPYMCTAAVTAHEIMEKYVKARAGRTEEQLIELFTFDNYPYLSYEYRKESSGYKADLPALKSLIKKGIINIYEKNTKTIVYHLNPAVKKATKS